jgi:MRG-binding protein
MRWKPTGIHKHFHLLALHAWLLENHYIHPQNSHTRPAGIWAKLNTLYDLPSLDAREDARQLPPLDFRRDLGRETEEEMVDDDADVYSEAANKIEEEEFTLPPEDGFLEEMWKRRIPSLKCEAEGDGVSEPELPELNLAEEPPIRFVASFSVEPSETTMTPGSRKGRGKKKGGRGGAAATATAPAPRRSARQAESTADEDEANEDESRGDVEADEGDDDDEEESAASERASQASTPAPRATRTTAKGGRGRGRGRGRGGGRGRK